MRHETMVFKEGSLKLIDQRKLPNEVEYFDAEDYRDVRFAISDMVVRGAPAIGTAGAYGVYLAAREFSHLEKEELIQQVSRASDRGTSSDLLPSFSHRSYQNLPRVSQGTPWG